MQINQSKGQRASVQFMAAIAIATLLPVSLAHAQVQSKTAAPAPTQAAAQPAESGTLARVRSTGKLVLGYRADAHPMSYLGTSGRAAGYAVMLCQRIADELKMQLELPALAVDWVEVTAATSSQAVQQGRIDLLCTADPVTLARRKDVSFSVPIFFDGIGGVIRANASEEFQRGLEARPEPYKPLWRGTPPPILQHKTASVVAGSSAVELLAKRVSELKMITTISTEESYAAGMTKVAEGKSDVLFGDRSQLLALTKQNADGRKLTVLNRHYTYEPQALTLARNDDDFRLAVDHALAAVIASPKFGELYQSIFGKADADTVEFFRSVPR